MAFLNIFQTNCQQRRFPPFGPCMLIHIITICASAAENRMVSSSTSSNAVSPVTVMNAVHNRDSWTSFRAAFASGRKSFNDFDTAADPSGETGNFGHDGWNGRQQSSRFGRPFGSSGTVGLANYGEAAKLLAETPALGAGLLSTDQLQQYDSASMRTYFNRAMAHLQVLAQRTYQMTSDVLHSSP